MMALYIPGGSVLHRLPAAAKRVALPAAGAGLFWLSGAGPLTLAALGVLALFAAARLPMAETWRALRPAVVLLAAIGMFHGAVNGWEAGAVVLLRIGIMMLLATLVTLTTPLSDMMDCLERALWPLRLARLSPARAALVLSLAVRLVPLLTAELERAREAQRARGLERSVLALLLPFLVGSLRLARDMGDAIEARGGASD